MSVSASASTSTNAPSLSPSLRNPPPPNGHPSSASQSTSRTSTQTHASTHVSTHASTLPHSPETLRQIAEARTALEASMLNIGNNLSAELKSRAQNLHANSAQLDKQMKDVQKGTKALQKQNDKLGKMAHDGQQKMKELGNVQNWAEMLERDFLVLEETLRLVKKGEEEGSDWSGGYSGSGSYSGSEDGERDEESLAGDRRREGIGKGFVVNEEEMGFLDVYGLEEDSAMEGVETEAEDGEGKGEGFTETPTGTVEKSQLEELKLDGAGDVMMSSDHMPPVDKGKGKEVIGTDTVMEEEIIHPTVEAVGGSSTATGSTSDGPSSTSHPSSALASSATSAHTHTEPIVG